MNEKRLKSRRSSRRLIKPLHMPVFWEGSSGRIAADMWDLGIGGCFLNTAGEAADGERITVQVPKPTKYDTVASFDGIVVPQQRKLKGFGVRFFELTEEQQAVIGLIVLSAEEFLDRRKR